ncbi:DUF1211 domain-containing protein [bacterium]|nr:DUF1211 domain-containing protein [bacterium]
MGKGRIEAFSDGVIAIIITIMVLELKVPAGGQLEDMAHLVPVFVSYVLSFVFIGIYWSNHHHLFHAVREVTGGILWANLHLLFWLSLIPFVTNWMGENFLSPWPVAIYGIVLLLSGIAYYILSQFLIRHHGKDSTLGIAVGKDVKGIISLVVYLIAVPIAFNYPLGAYILYILVAVLWIVPDRRIESTIKIK